MCLSSLKPKITVGLSNHGSLLVTIFLKGSAYIVHKLVLHPYVTVCKLTDQ